MISNAVVFDDNEKVLIETKLAEENFSSDSWDNDEFDLIKAKIKQFYLRVQNNTCPYCKQRINSNHGRYWDTEHIIPRAYQKNFMFEPKNLCVSCVDCNGRKSDKKITSSRASVRLPTRSDLYYIVHPHLDSYDENIMIIKEGFYYVALRSKGEKTIEVCGLNRFYEFADYNDHEDDRMLMLTQELCNTNSEDRKTALRSEIAYLAINGNMAQANQP